MTQEIVWMQRAIQLAHAAAERGEVPVGALLVADGILLAEGYNQSIFTHDPTAHAEIVALRKAGEILGNYRLINTTLYVTLEPCIMCLGAMIHARVEKLVFGAYDLRAGAVTSAFQIVDTGKLNHKLNYSGGHMAEECGKILSDFFRARR
jgi:tRNA(adenine34) deaminase